MAAVAIKADKRFADEKHYQLDSHEGVLFRRLRHPEKGEVIDTVMVNGLAQQYRFAQVATVDSEAKPDRAPGPNARIEKPELAEAK